MARPQPTDAHLRIAHRISEQLMVSNFTEQQRRILDLILRLSWGCGKKFAIIPHQSDFETIGVGRTHIKAHLDWLIEAKVIDRREMAYWFNKDYDQWRVSRALQYSPLKVTELVTLNLKPVTENVIEVLRKTEQGCYLLSNSATPKLDTPKERLNKVKESIYIYFADNVKMSPMEHDKLVELFGEQGTKDRIENLSLYKKSKGKKYKDDYATILTWERRDQKEKGGQGGTYKGHSRELKERSTYKNPDEHRQTG